MGWKGTLRSIRAAQRRAEREAQRRRRELERQRKQLEKMRELERAAYEVQVYENYIDLLLSVHKEGSDVWDWEAIRSSELPTNIHEELAQAKLDGFKPGVFDELLGRAESKRDELVRAVEEAKQADEKEYQEALQARELADRILGGSAEAYLDAIRQTDPFSDISELGSSIEFRVENSSLVEATLHVNSEQVIPSEVKSLLKSGKLSVKQMPQSRFYELYQDYVCGCVLRVARELFALLPIEMVIVNAVGNLLNTQTGYMEEQPILSVAIPRKTLEGLDFEMLDPSDSMSNFVHRMEFRKTKGFSAVETLRPSDLQKLHQTILPMKRGGALTDTDDLLKQGIAALKAGQKAEARRLLERVVQQDENNETAWLWLSGAVDTDSERIHCLRETLRINPDNQHARRGLEKLEGEVPISRLAQTVEKKPIQPLGIQTPPAKEEKNEGMPRGQNGKANGFSVSWTRVNLPVRRVARDLAFCYVDFGDDASLASARRRALDEIRERLVSGELAWHELEDAIVKTNLFEDWEAKQIARTTTTTCWAESHRLTAKEAGQTHKRSIRADKGRQCPNNVCNKAEELGWIPIDALYSEYIDIPFGDVQGPAFHQGCHCYMQFGSERIGLD